MVYITNVFCDWMTCVAPQLSLRDWPRRNFDLLKTKQVKGGAYGHKYAVEYTEYGIVHHFTTATEPPSVLVIPGHAWSAIREKWGESDALKIMRIFARHCDHITRIDLSMDIYDGGDLSYEISDSIFAGSLNTGRRKARTVRGKSRLDGCTNYIGVRASPKMLRIYDKLAESGGILPTTRIEFELKAEAALAVGKELSLYEGFLRARPIFVGLLKDFIELEQFYALDKLMYDEVEVLNTIPHQRQLEWEQWITRQVLPSFNPFKHPEAADRIAWMYNKLDKAKSGA